MNHEETKHMKVYRSVLSEVLFVRFVPSWFANAGRR